MNNILNPYRNVYALQDLSFLTDDLTHYYPLVSNSEDEISAIDGTDTAISYSDNGDFQNTSNFTAGNTSQISFNDDDSFSFGDGVTDSDFSISLRFCFNVLPTQCFLIGKRNASTDREFQLAIDTPGVTLRWRQFDQSSGAIRRVDYVLNPVVDTWYHVIITHSSGTLKMYIDGIDVGNASEDVGYVSMEAGAENLILGKYSASTTFSLNGYLGEFAIWEKELTPFQVGLISSRYAENKTLLEGV